MLTLILFCLLAYAIGSLSSAIIVCRLMGLPDPRTVGSLNPGATNVLRSGNKKAAVFTLLGDTVKGVIPVLVIMHLNPRPLWVGLVMLSVFLGHLYPVFFGFKGGKGVATALGVLIGLYWPLGCLVFLTWIIVVYITRISSVGALVVSFLAPFYTAWLVNIKLAGFVLVMSLFLFWRHRENIKRLYQGTEKKA